VPYADRITESRATCKSGGSNIRCSRRAPRSARSRIVDRADRGLCGGTTHGHPARRARMRDHASTRAGRDNARPSAARRGLLPFPRLPDRRAVRGLQRQPRYEDARDIAGRVLSPFEAGELDLVSALSTRVHLAGRQEVSSARCCPRAVGLTRPATAAEEPQLRLRVRAESEKHPRRRCCRATRIAHLRGVAQRRRVGARGPPAAR
jgi:F0F1-type ATP synthase gamma subunit